MNQKQNKSWDKNNKYDIEYTNVHSQSSLSSPCTHSHLHRSYTTFNSSKRQYTRPKINLISSSDLNDINESKKEVSKPVET